MKEIHVKDTVRTSTRASPNETCRDTRQQSETTAPMESPPVISLQSETIVQDIYDACSTWGALVLVDHGLNPELLQNVLATGHTFFELPNKNDYNLQKHGSKWRGYMPLGGERSIQGKIRDYKEGLYMGDEHNSNHPRMGLPTFGSNVFPEAEIPHMKSLFLDYHEQMKQLGNTMMCLLSKALGLKDKDYLNNHITLHDPVILPRMFRYLPRPQDANEDEYWGIGEHSDYGLWTMILTDSPGLEFQHPITKEWKLVPFLPNGIIMNVGDVLDRLTAGRFVSAYHRARNLSTNGEYRLSLPFFCDPAWDARMQTLPLPEEEELSSLDTPERALRWSRTKITCEFDGQVEYSEFLAKKVAKVFPDLVPESVWKNLKSTSEPSTRHALVVASPEVFKSNKVMKLVEGFYKAHTEIKASHGIQHVVAVHEHAMQAIAAHTPPLPARAVMEVQMAALLHDVDDSKYFPKHLDYENARSILEAAEMDPENVSSILEMIGLVSCSQNGNHVPESIAESGEYYRLIPRWSDRLEAVGKVGVVRCYQYNVEHQRPLSSATSPRTVTEEDVWKHATPDRFDAYLSSGGHSDDMISHYYDKLLHVARPPKEIVRNPYLEEKARESSQELVEMCLRFGKTGTVDGDFVKELAEELNIVL